MTFKEVYKFPLNVDDSCPIITWTADNQRAFDWCVDVSSEKQQELIDMINGTKQHQFKHKFYREGIEIHSENPIFKGEPVLLIRGWGHLRVLEGCIYLRKKLLKFRMNLVIIL